MNNAITILSLFVAGISGVASILWSTRYMKSKQAELDAKDAEINAKESELRSRLASKVEQLKLKDEQIQMLEIFQSPMLVERFKNKIALLEELNAELYGEVDELKKANETLLKQVREVNLSNQRFSESIPGLAVPEEVRSSLTAYVTGSGNVIQGIGQSAYGLLLVGERIMRTTDEISKVTSLELDPTPTASVVVTDIVEVEVTDPVSSETNNDNVNVDEPDDSEDGE